MTAEETLLACQRAVDYAAADERMWFDECDKEGQHGTELQRRYQAAHNALVILRQKLTVEWIAQMLNRPENDPPPALLRIFLDEPPQP